MTSGRPAMAEAAPSTSPKKRRKHQPNLRSSTTERRPGVRLRARISAGWTDGGRRGGRRRFCGSSAGRGGERKKVRVNCSGKWVWGDSGVGDEMHRSYSGFSEGRVDLE